MLLVKGKPPLQPGLGYTLCWMGLTADRPGGPSEYPMGDAASSPVLSMAATTTPGGTVLLAPGLGSWGIWVTAPGDLELCR